MDNLWKKKFSPIDVEAPNKVLNQQGEYLNDATDGLIIAKATEYDGDIHSRTILGISSLAITNISDRKFNVQDELGDIQENKFKFEFYIASPKAPDYKYRVMFFEYNISLYPVNIVLDEEIANEINAEEEISCETIDDFKVLLTSVLNSSKIEKVINALLSISDI